MKIKTIIPKKYTKPLGKRYKRIVKLEKGKEVVYYLVPEFDLKYAKRAHKSLRDRYVNCRDKKNKITNRIAYSIARTNDLLQKLI